MIKHSTRKGKHKHQWKEELDMGVNSFLPLKSTWPGASYLTYELFVQCYAYSKGPKNVNNCHRNSSLYLTTVLLRLCDESRPSEFLNDPV